MIITTEKNNVIDFNQLKMAQTLLWRQGTLYALSRNPDEPTTQLAHGARS